MVDDELKQSTRHKRNRPSSRRTDQESDRAAPIGEATKDYSLLFKPLDCSVRVPNIYWPAYRDEEPAEQRLQGRCERVELDVITDRYGEDTVERVVTHKKARPPTRYPGLWRNRWCADQKVLTWILSPRYWKHTGEMVKTYTGDWEELLVPPKCPHSITISFDMVAAMKIAPTPLRLTMDQWRHITLTPVVLRDWVARPITGTDQRLRYRFGDEPYLVYVEQKFIEWYDLNIPEPCWLQDAIFDSERNPDKSRFVLGSIQNGKVIISAILSHGGVVEPVEDEVVRRPLDPPESAAPKPKPQQAKMQPTQTKPRQAKAKQRESQPVAALRAVLAEFGSGTLPRRKLLAAFKPRLGEHSNPRMAFQRALDHFQDSGMLTYTEQSVTVLVSPVSE